MKKVLGQLRTSALLNKPVRTAIKNLSRLSKSITDVGIAHWPVAGTVSVSFEDLNFRMYSECDDSLAGALYYSTDYVELFDLSFFNKLSKKSSCILDIGANTGILCINGGHE